jgi:hypothetical protein
LKSQVMFSVDRLPQSVNFGKLLESNLDLAPKRGFVPHDLLYKCANLQKLERSESIYFKGPNRANPLSFQTDEIF